jgi:hypothetical protein
MKWRISATSAVIAAVTVGGGLAGLSIAAAYAQNAPPGGTWGQVRQLSGLPASNSLVSLDVSAVSCSSAGDCGAIGSYQLSAANIPSEAFVVTEKGGIWGKAQAIPGLAALNVGKTVSDLHISCATAGNCSAVGTYSRGKPGQSPYNFDVPFVVRQSNGVWGTAKPVSLGNLGGAGVPARLGDISCSSPGDCAATGDYGTFTGPAAPFIINELDGTWSEPMGVPGIASVPPSPTFGAVITAISCPADGDCAMGGIYQADDNGGEGSFVADEKSGVWGDAAKLPGLAALTTRPSARLTSISCAAAGACTVAGSYDAASDGRQLPFVASEQGGTWGNAQLLPGSVELNVGGGLNTELVSCPTAGGCTLAATYWPFSTSPQPSSGGGSLILTASESGGTWGNAVKLPGLPSGVTAGAFLRAMACGSVGNCSLGGYYNTRTSLGIAFLANDLNGTWHTARVAMPALSGAQAVVTAVSCGAPGYCSALISDDRTLAHIVPFVAEYGVTEATASVTKLKLSTVTASYGKEQSVRMTFTVASAYGTPTGTVTVGAGGIRICTTTLKSGKGSCVLTAKQLKVGGYRLVANYSGSATYSNSASSPATLKITK